jgi:hypothetical protein
MHPNVFFICIGEIHSDPAAKLAALETLKKFHNKNIPIIYCAEKPSDSDLIDEVARLDRGIDVFEDAIRRCELEPFFYQSNGKYLPFFSEDNREALHSKLKEDVDDSDVIHLSSMVSEFIKLPAKRAERALLTYLHENGIKYLPIDIIESERSAFKTKIDKSLSFDDILEYENHRITTMRENIYRGAIQKLHSTGGIIICDVGNLHSHRLAANLHYQYQIPSIALFCHSAQYGRHLGGLSREISISKDKVDSDVIKKLYEQILYFPLYFTSDNNGDLKNKMFDNLVDFYLYSITSSQITSKQVFAYAGSMAAIGLFSSKTAEVSDNISVKRPPTLG